MKTIDRQIMFNAIDRFVDSYRTASDDYERLETDICCKEFIKGIGVNVQGYTNYYRKQKMEMLK